MSFSESQREILSNSNLLICEYNKDMTQTYLFVIKMCCTRLFLYLMHMIISHWEKLASSGVHLYYKRHLRISRTSVWILYLYKMSL